MGRLSKPIKSQTQHNGKKIAKLFQLKHESMPSEDFKKWLTR